MDGSEEFAMLILLSFTIFKINTQILKIKLLKKDYGQKKLVWPKYFITANRNEADKVIWAGINIPAAESVWCNDKGPHIVSVIVYANTDSGTWGLVIS